eukprot:TRINITY_DN122700_c0_g1_i1.p1 TRINITY_DN122700_c0_g1~~TRINITY_DN122700_c0_g1_i1.p1  ORF type:complete len:293 (-),score=40.74 TRINITY_DN122700_c0_g1_i1:122-1000(-)
MPPPRSRGGSPAMLSRGAERQAPTSVNMRPSGHAHDQYQGLLRGIGTSSKVPICAKKSSMTGRIHNATHFAIGCKKWDEEKSGISRTHEDFADPEVVYATVDVPDKNSSVVELRTQPHVPELHFKSEQRDRFDNPGPQPLDLPYRAHVSVHLGDDRPALVAQSHAVHTRSIVHGSEGQRRAGSLQSAGYGCLEPNSVIPRPDRHHPIHGGDRVVDNYDLGAMNQHKFNRYTGNHSNFLYEANVRNPVLGHCTPLQAYGSTYTSNLMTTQQKIAEANATMPKLRSLGALRPDV